MAQPVGSSRVFSILCRRGRGIKTPSPRRGDWEGRRTLFPRVPRRQASPCRRSTRGYIPWPLRGQERRHVPDRDRLRSGVHSHSFAGQLAGLLHPSSGSSLVELVVLVDVEVTHFHLLGRAARDGTQRRLFGPEGVAGCSHGWSEAQPVERGSAAQPVGSSRVFSILPRRGRGIKTPPPLAAIYNIV